MQQGFRLLTRRIWLEFDMMQVICSTCILLDCNQKHTVISLLIMKRRGVEANLLQLSSPLGFPELQELQTLCSKLELLFSTLFFFGHLGPEETTLTSSLNWNGELVSKQLLIYTSSSSGTTLSFIWSRVSGHLVNVSLSLSSVCSLHQLLRETSGSLAAKCSTVFTS